MNRLSASLRAAITAKPSARVLFPIGRPRLARQDALQTPRDRLDRRQRIVQFVPQHANQPLPGFQFFGAQRLRKIGHHYELM